MNLLVSCTGHLLPVHPLRLSRAHRLCFQQHTRHFLGHERHAEEEDEDTAGGGEEAGRREAEKRDKRGWFSFLNFDSTLKEVREMMNTIFSERSEDSTQVAMLKSLRRIRKDMKKTNRQLAGEDSRPDFDSDSDSEGEAKPEENVVPVEEALELPQVQPLREPPEQKENTRVLFEEDADNPA